MTSSAAGCDDRSATGSDRTGLLCVHVDPSSLRVLSVVLLSVPEALRRPDGLARAVDEAHRQATLRLAVRDREARPAGRRTARTLTTPPPRPRVDLDPGRRPDLEMLHSLGDVRSVPLRGSGDSDNGCVRVRLLPASARGTVEVLSPGWLTQASGHQIGAALTQAFTRAYENRSNR